MFLLGGLLAVLLAGLLVLQRMEQREAALIRIDAQQSRVQMLNHWLDLTSRSLPQAAAELAQSEEMARVAARPKAAAQLTPKGCWPAKTCRHFEWLERTGIPAFKLNQRARTKTNTPSPRRFQLRIFKTFFAKTPSLRFFAE